MILAAITTCKRKPDMVERAVKSVVAQTYRDWNLVVVDDSPADYEFRDDVRKMVESYAEKDSRIRYVPHDRNYGAQRARNTALDIADREGYEFIAYLDDDDEWLPEKLEKQLAVFMSHDEKLGLVYCGAYGSVKDDATGKYVSYKRKMKFHEGKIYDKLIFEDFIGSFSRPLIRARYLKEVGGLEEKMPVRQDWETWLRLSRYYEISYVNEALIRSTPHEGEHVGRNHVQRPQALVIIISKNLDYLKKHKYAYWKIYRELALECERNAYSAWIKTLQLQPLRVISNLTTILRIPSETMICTIKYFVRKFFPCQFSYLKKLNIKLKGGKIIDTDKRTSL
ncbi:MAG: glycosyltransferase family 2 protein [Synergistaceae bacterium]|nr:glycosyltransferase family 2 protein [Synergistaceae bacterium]